MQGAVEPTPLAKDLYKDLYVVEQRGAGLLAVAKVLSWTSSFFRLLKKLSVMALSVAFPLRLMLG
jgi:hypothetical protein